MVFPTPDETEELQVLRRYVLHSQHFNGVIVVPIAGNMQIPNNAQPDLANVDDNTRHHLFIRGDKRLEDGAIVEVAGPDFIFPRNNMNLQGLDAQHDLQLNLVNIPENLQVNFMDFGDHAAQGNISIAFDPFQLPDPAHLEGFAWNHVFGKGQEHYYLGICTVEEFPEENVEGHPLGEFINAIHQRPIEDFVLVAVISNNNEVRYINRGDNGVVLVEQNNLPNNYFQFIDNPQNDVDLDNLFQ